MSGGQKRKLTILIALLGNNELILLDEPYYIFIIIKDQ